MPPLALPLAPMLARLARELPLGEHLVYEPKWDGFRCIAEVAGGAVVLHSRNERPLTRYFPEVVAALAGLPDGVVDGELVVCSSGRADFPALMARLHPAASRAAALAAATPADLVAFDLLADGDTDLTGHPFVERRTRLEALLATPPDRVAVTPQTADAVTAGDWLDAPAGSGIDGVVAKDLRAPYAPGVRAVVKVKRARTADCVVAGVRVHAEGGFGSLLLGLWEGPVLHHVGVAAALARAERPAVTAALTPIVTDLAGHPWERGFGLEGGALGRFRGTAGRWVPGMPQDWLPLRPERVAEVAYDHVEGWRFRHPARLVRWRPDRDAASCTVEQLA